MTEQEKQEPIPYEGETFKILEWYNKQVEEYSDCAVFNFAKNNPGQTICLYCTCKRCNPWC